ncbi:MAG: 1,2-phenylacetyl-CoA epoxidase subunit B [Mycobacteriales bacterium]
MPEPWPLWEVFVRSRSGLAHQHAGSVHAVDAEMALTSARDAFTRRGEASSLWVVPAGAITASDPADKEAFFGADLELRHPAYYVVPAGVTGL